MDDEALFDAALEQPNAAARRAFLDAACADDPGQQRRIERLLAADGQAVGILERGPGTVVVSSVPPGPPLAADRPFAGRFQLRQKLGEGGMGEVWVADQTEPVQRRVALKLIRSGFDSAHLLARFEQERQSLALMDHPNIAKVLDAGVADGRPYFVMEVIPGVPMTEYCDAAQLSPRERLELFIPVCQAMQHAHQKGIVHRDLKPSNILVARYDGRPVPKVIDFGVAKATGPRLTEQSLHTEVGCLIGTLEYMSPEQAQLNNLDIDTRSDIYALGAVLYELLTGSVPFSRRELPAGAVTDILRLIREVDPPKPSTRLAASETLPGVAAGRHTEPRKLVALVRGELDWIVMKCLEKDRDRRYQTADELARDLERYLRDEPVLAGPPSARYRLRKFARRRWRGVAAASAFVLLLVTAVVTLAVALVAVNRERWEKETALEAEGQRRQQARAALDALTSPIIEGWLAQQPRLSVGHKQFLEQALRAYEEFAADTGQHEKSRSGVAQAYSRVGLIRERLGQWTEAEAACQRSRELYAKLVADFPTDPEYQHHLAQTDNNLGDLLKVTGRLREAETAFTRALTIHRQLAGDFPTRPEFRQALATSYHGLAILLQDTGRPTEAEATYAQAQTILAQLASDFPTRPEFRQALAASYHGLGTLLKNTDRLTEAEAACGQAVAIYRQLFADVPDLPDYRFSLAQTQITRGVLLDILTRSREAAETLAEAAALSRQLAADFPTVPIYRESLARSLNNLGDILRAAKRHPEAEDAFRQVLTVRKPLAADFPTVPEYREGLASALNNLGILLKDTGRAPEAEELYGQALAIHKQLAADFPTVSDHRNNAAGAMVNLARLLGARQEFAGARRLLEEAVPYHEAALKASPRHPAYRRFYRNNRWRLAETLLELKDHAAAADAAGQFLQAATEPARDAYTAAGLLAGCARLAGQDEQLPESQRQELTATYGDSAVAALRLAITKGAKEVAQMKTDPSLDPLRHRADFQKLLAEVDTTSQPNARDVPAQGPGRPGGR